jgi:release factor glutamine methyltransferase
VLSVYAASKGALVTATDISKKAVENTRKNAELHEQLVRIIESDMFNSIPQESFDFIIVNPPYYNNNPKTEADLAWYCGTDFEYFSEFFSGLGKYANGNSNVIMILSEDCIIARIRSIAEKNRWNMLLLYSTKNFMERNYLFKIEREQ